MLTKRESDIMWVIWNISNERDRQLKYISEKLNEKIGMNLCPQTVSTMLSRLVNKGFLEMLRDGKEYYYRTHISMQDYFYMEVQRMEDYYGITLKS